MVGFIRLRNNAVADNADTGEAIIKVSKSVFKTSAGSEWKKFDADTRKWLHDNGYVYDGPGAGPTGEIPDSVEIVPVYDTPTRMHVKVPWAGDLTGPNVFPDEPTYGPIASPTVRKKVLLARYFMRKCR